MNQNRVQQGVPTGGQFAATARGEADVDLQPAAGQFAPTQRAESDVELTAETPPAKLPIGTAVTLELPTEVERDSIVAKESLFTRKYETQEEKLAALHVELEERVLDLHDDRAWNDYLDTMSRFHRYSFGNQMLIAAQSGGKATHVAGFNTWKGVERSVVKGEKGIVILAPKIVNAAEKDANGKPVMGADGKPNKSRRCVGSTTATVFDISQTDGKPLPDGGHRELSETPPVGFREDLEKAVADSGFKVSYEDIPGDANGYTSPDGRVVIQQGMTPAQEAKTLAHELGHIKAGHMDRLDEYHQGHGGSRGSMEVEAESVAYVLCRSNGMTPQVGDYSGRYVAGWGGTNGETVRKSAEHVQKTVKEILGGGGFRNAED